jgi:hypothetical protein
MDATFSLYALRFEFTALDRVVLPEGNVANVFRGAFGEILRRLACVPECPGAKVCGRRSECAYARLFEPRLEGGPSGLADPPRPFVLRPRTAGGTLHAGQGMALDFHFFEHAVLLPPVIQTFAQLVREGLGPGRGRAALERVTALDADRGPVAGSHPAAIRIPLEPVAGERVNRIRVEFLTPTELKTEGRIEAGTSFETLIRRLRDRIATLSALYGKTPLEFDYRALAEDAAKVVTASSAFRRESAERYSTRTRQSHPLGGFTGEAEYAGPGLDRFLPLLRIGEWCGVGRQTVWGKGEFRLTVLE